VLVHVVVELPRGREVVPEGLLDDDAGVLDEAGSGQPLHHGAEQERRDLEVVDRAPLPVEHPGETLERLGIGEVPGDVGHPRREALEDLLVDRLPGALDRTARVCAQVLDGPVVDSDADDRTGQQAAPLQAVQRPERHDLREITCDAEAHEGVGAAGRIALHRASRRARSVGCGHRPSSAGVSVRDEACRRRRARSSSDLGDDRLAG
jgi:hypothetical protein